MHQPVVIDVETQQTFRDVGGYDPKKLKISVAGMYEYASDHYFAFTEPELPKLFSYLENASTIIGFNIIDFDLPVLNPYYVGDLTKFAVTDLLKTVEKQIGFRLALDDLVRETLGAKKTGHGLLAIEYFRNGEMNKLKEYCLSDVRLTKDLYEYGKANGKVFYNTASGRREIQVDWGIAKNPAVTNVNLTLPW
ncbi:MAG: ribonuclease H-like domain-containing protein [Patescibacteria group bacterium]